MSYSDFIAQKSELGTIAEPVPFVDADIPERAFPHQSDLIRWSLRRGRAAIFADTGLGKSLMQLVWAACCAKHGRVLILAPLAVAEQTVREGEKFGIEVNYLRGDDYATRIVITNYEMLDRFNPADFCAVVLDESSILKASDGKTRTRIIEAFAETRWRLACTATPAPNDHTELGNHAQFLGIKTREEMLAEYFVHDGGETQTWRLKGHAVDLFWAWVCTWGAVVKRPSDIGHSDDGFVLPPLNMHERVVAVNQQDAMSQGYLFAPAAMTLSEQRATRRATLESRVRVAAEIVRASWEEAVRPTGEITMPRIANSDSPISAPLTDGIEKSDSPPSAPQEKGAPKKRKNGRANTIATTTSRTENDTKSEREPSNSPGTDSTSADSLGCSSSRAELAPSASANLQTDGASTSTTTTRPEQSAESSATNATSCSVDSPTTPRGCATQGSTAPHATSSRRREKWLIWVELNDEQDALAEAFGADCVSIYGSLSPEEKVRREIRWREGDVPVLITKPSIFGFGLNWQHACKMIFAGVSHSYEQTYQAIRRSWRFGQKRPVDVFMIRAETEDAIIANLRRKEADAERMAVAMVEHMRETMRAEISSARREWNPYQPIVSMKLPQFLRSAS